MAYYSTNNPHNGPKKKKAKKELKESKCKGPNCKEPESNKTYKKGKPKKAAKAEGEILRDVTTPGEEIKPRSATFVVKGKKTVKERHIDPKKGDKPVTEQEKKTQESAYKTFGVKRKPSTTEETTTPYKSFSKDKGSYRKEKKAAKAELKGDKTIKAGSYIAVGKKKGAKTKKTITFTKTKKGKVKRSR